MEPTSNARLPNSIFFFLVFVGVVQANFYSSRLPPIVATHFAKGGLANGWQTQFQSMCVEVGIVVLATVIAFGIPRILGAVPISLINVQNKQYWFAPERREVTLAFFKFHFAWFGCALLAFLLFVNELVFRANLTSARRLDTTAFVTAMFAFLTFVAVWTIRLIFHFSRVPK